jgi:hypothetical protein
MMLKRFGMLCFCMDWKNSKPPTFSVVHERGVWVFSGLEYCSHVYGLCTIFLFTVLVCRVYASANILRFFNPARCSVNPGHGRPEVY